MTVEEISEKQREIWDKLFSKHKLDMTDWEEVADDLDNLITDICDDWRHKMQNKANSNDLFQLAMHCIEFAESVFSEEDVKEKISSYSAFFSFQAQVFRLKQLIKLEKAYPHDSR